MELVKFNISIFDSVSKETFAPTGDFQEISSDFADRLREFQKKNKQHKDSFEFKSATKVTKATKTAKEVKEAE